MARPVLIMTVLAGVACGGGVSPARAELRCEHPTVDAGEVKCGPLLAREFVLENTGRSAVRLDVSRTSCGCLKPRLGRPILNPGERTTLRVEVNTLSQPEGTERWTVRVAAQDLDEAPSLSPAGPRDQEPQGLELTITATIRAEIRIQPAALAVYSSRPVTQQLVVTDARPKPFNVTAVRASSPTMAVKVVDHRRDGDGRVETVIRLDVRPEPASGPSDPGSRHEETVSIYTDDPGYREMVVPVSVVPRERQRVVALPPTVRVTASAGQPVPSTIVLLSDRDGESVVVDAVESDHPAVSCTSAKGPGERSTLRVRVDRDKCVGVSVNAVLTVKLKGPAGVTVAVPVSCTLP